MFHLETYLFDKVDFHVTKDRKTQYLDKREYVREKVPTDLERAAAPARPKEVNESPIVKDLMKKLKLGALKVEDLIKLFEQLFKQQKIDKSQTEIIHKHLYRLVLLMSDLSGGMIRMADVISVN